MALYILSVTQANPRRGASLSDSYYLALLSTGKVVVMTGITLGVAVITWVLSPIRFQADMGILLGFMWRGALVLVPALGHFLLKPQLQSVADQKTQLHRAQASPHEVQCEALNV